MSAVPKTPHSTRSAAPRPGVTSPKKTMSIGVVMKTLADEFPDLSVSKLRYLETEGLVSPQRTKAGYRRFTDADVDRLRYVLRAQRDQYLPLKVIRENLESLDSAGKAQVESVSPTAPAAVPGMDAVLPQPVAHPSRLTSSELASAASCEESLVEGLLNEGVISPDASGYFNHAALKIVMAASAFTEAGLGIAQLKRVRSAAQRQADIVRQAVASRSTRADSARREEVSNSLTSVVVALNSAFLEAELKSTVGER